MRTIADLVSDNRSPSPAALGNLRMRLAAIEAACDELVFQFGDLLESIAGLRAALDDDDEAAAADPNALKFEDTGDVPG